MDGPVDAEEWTLLSQDLDAALASEDASLPSKIPHFFSPEPVDGILVRVLGEQQLRLRGFPELYAKLRGLALLVASVKIDGLRYAVFSALCDAGWVVRPGEKYNCDYLAYSSAAEHSLYCVHVLSAGFVEARELVMWERISHSVKKSLLLAWRDLPEQSGGFGDSEGRTKRIEWLEIAYSHTMRTWTA